MQKKEKIIIALVGTGVVLMATFMLSRTFMKSTHSGVPETPCNMAVSSVTAPGNTPAAPAVKDWSADDFRVRNLSIGMTEEELIKGMGEPEGTSVYSRKDWTKSFWYPGLVVWTRYSPSKGVYVVYQFEIKSRAYATFRGIQAGASKAQVEAVYGPSEWIDPRYPEIGFQYTNKTFCAPNRVLKIMFLQYNDTIWVSEDVDWAAKDAVLAGLTLDMDESEVIRALGNPPSKNQNRSVLIYEYPGLTVYLSDQNGKIAVHRVVVTVPDFPTTRGIRVGDSLDKVWEIYGDDSYEPWMDGPALEFVFNPDDSAVTSIDLYHKELPQD